MAIYHLNIKIVSRGNGKSAVAAAAYRSGTKITNQYDGEVHDYTSKSGVINSEIMLPDNAPREFINRDVLWNAVEKIDKNCDSQLAREIEIALPRELTHEEHLKLMREFVNKNFVSKGMVCDMSFHTPHPKNVGNENPHVHILLTMRPFKENGAWDAKCKKQYILDENGEKIRLASGNYKSEKVDTTDWNQQYKAEEWRQSWAEMLNRALSENNIEERVDHRSYERQRIDKIPDIHLGISATQMEKKGVRTDRGNVNREISVTNSQIKQIKARINKLQKWIDDSKDARIPNSKSSDAINLIELLVIRPGAEPLQYKYQRIQDLKSRALILTFLQNNHIQNLPELQAKIAEMTKTQTDMAKQLKKVERRVETLNKHLENAEKYFEHQATYKAYMKLKPAEQTKRYEQFAAPVIHYEAAKKYLDGVMNGRKNIPLKSWKQELAIVKAEKAKLYSEYQKLKDDVKDVEHIKKQIETVLSYEEPVRENSKNRNDSSL